MFMICVPFPLMPNAAIPSLCTATAVLTGACRLQENFTARRSFGSFIGTAHAQCSQLPIFTFAPFPRSDPPHVLYRGMPNTNSRDCPPDCFVGCDPCDAQGRQPYHAHSIGIARTVDRAGVSSAESSPNSHRNHALPQFLAQRRLAPGVRAYALDRATQTSTPCIQVYCRDGVGEVASERHLVSQSQFLPRLLVLRCQRHLDEWR